ncbi:MAG: transposase [Chloroflexota bacterium]|nr:transposase [Chloroflexota bacterium]
MEESTVSTPARRFSARASLAALGLKLRSLDLFGPVRETVKIAQKTVKHRPTQKLYDAFITLLTGAQGLVEINSRLRSDPAVQRAFGRSSCAEQSVVQETLDRCTAENVTQLEQAMAMIMRRYGQAAGHNFAQGWLLLDGDMTGLPCGPKAACATKGYFAKQRNRHGRQLGRVVATDYDEIIVDRLYPGTTQLHAALPQLVLAAEAALELDEPKRHRTILRLDGGGGSRADVNWALWRGYAVHCKDCSTQRADKLAASVTEWVDDPRNPGRQVGWGMEPTRAYVRPVRRIAVRCPTKDRGWAVGVIISALEPRDVVLLTRQPVDRVNDPTAVLLAYVYFYDQRGGGVETANKEDKQGLGLSKRNKKRFEAQQMVVLLSALAHNVLVWARGWLAPHHPKLAQYGIKRWVRDLWQISGCLEFSGSGAIRQIVVNQAAPLAAGLVAALRGLVAVEGVSISLGEI